MLPSYHSKNNKKYCDLPNENVRTWIFGHSPRYRLSRQSSDPEVTTFKNDVKMCRRNSECFELSVRKDTTIMEAYNCDRQRPGAKSSTMPAEKQLYRPD